MTIIELRKRLRFWKRELNLQDWSITLRLPKGVECDDCHGFVRVNKEHGKAPIVIKEGDFAEYWLLHELGHIVLSGLCNEENSKTAETIEERAVNRYTTALCRAKNIPCPPLSAIEIGQ